MSDSLPLGQGAREESREGAIRGTYLLIADVFYPQELPPEAKTNSFLARSLAEMGWRVLLWGGARARSPIDSALLEVVRNVRKWSFLELIRMTFWIAWNRPSRIGLTYFSTAYSLKAHINWVPLIAKWFGIPCTTLFTNGVAPNRNRFQEQVARWLSLGHLLELPIGLLGTSAHLVFYSAADREKLLSKEGRSYFSYSIVTPPSVLGAPPQSVFHRDGPEDFSSAAPFRLGYFGLIYFGKGLVYLIKALRLLFDRGHSVRLLVIGGGAPVTADEAWNQTCANHLKHLHQLARDLEIDHAITWCAYRSDFETAAMISGCHAICLPFDDGVTGLRSSFVECATIGVPLITTLTEASDDYFRTDGSGVLFVDPANPEQIAEAVMRLYESPALRLYSQEHVRRFAERYFRSSELVEAFLA
jgi:glycosyltransferase involved in cell wall biosynthesis